MTNFLTDGSRWILKLRVAESDERGYCFKRKLDEFKFSSITFLQFEFEIGLRRRHFASAHRLSPPIE